MMQFDYFINFPGLIIAKDINSTYINMSHVFAKFVGWKSAHDCCGKTDYEVPCPAVESADLFVEMDRKIVETKQKLLTLEIQNFVHGWKLLFVERNPIKNENGTIVAILTSCMDVTNIDMFKIYSKLHQFDNRQCKNSIKPAIYILSKSYSPLPLTDKQQEVLFFLIRGKSAKEIAKIFNGSHRTVEVHIEAIKKSLHCHHKSELFEKAMDKGFFYYIPKALQKSELNL